MSKRNILSLVTILVLVLGISVGATLAYLVNTSNTVENKFSVQTQGNVEITLDENIKTWDEKGKVLRDEQRIPGATIDIIPGGTIIKEPHIKVGPKSEDAYLFLKIQLTGMTVQQFKDLVGNQAYFDPNYETWEMLTADCTENVLYYMYPTKRPAGYGQMGPIRGKGFKVPTTGYEALKDLTITYTGFAVQASNYTDANAAWAAHKSDFIK